MILVLFSIFSSNLKANYDYIYSCKLEDHLDEDGNLKPNSRYKYFLCVQKKKKPSTLKAIRSTAAMTTGEGVLGIEDKDTLDIDSEKDTAGHYEQDHNIVFSISNIPVTEYDDTSTHTYHTIGVINPKDKEVGIKASFGRSTIREDVMDDVLQRFTRSRHFTIGGIGYCGGDFDYEVSVAAHLSLEDIKELNKKTSRMIDDAKIDPVETELTNLPLYGYFKRIIVPIVKSLYGEATNYLPIGLGLSGILSIGYVTSLKEAIARYEDKEEVNFTGCLIAVYITTTELLYDMYANNITSRLFTIRDTIGDIYNDTIVTGGIERSFQTTGRFREFLTDDCHCPRCGTNGHIVSNDFGKCDVDIILDSNFMFISLLELYQGNISARMTSLNELGGYISNIPNWNFLPPRTLEVTGNFSNVDTVDILGETLDRGERCDCGICPDVETSSSVSLGNLLASAVNIGIAVVATLSILGAVRLKDVILVKIRSL